MLAHCTAILGQILPIPARITDKRYMRIRLFTHCPLGGVATRGDAATMGPNMLGKHCHIAFAGNGRVAFIDRNRAALLDRGNGLGLRSRLSHRRCITEILSHRTGDAPPRTTGTVAITVHAFLRRGTGQRNSYLAVPSDDTARHISTSPTAAKTQAVAT